MIGALWVGTRQFVHERSGLPPPSLASPSFIFDDPIRTTQHLLDRVYSLIPLAFRPAHIAPLSPPPIIQGCFRNYVHSRLLTLEREGFPIYYGHTHVTSHAVAAQSTLAVFPPTSSLLRTLHKFQSLVSRPPNCYIQFKLCACGSVHGHLISLTDLDAGTPLYVGDPPVDHLDFVIQFDGGAFREHRVGGAGIVLWKHTTQGLTLLDTFAVPLFPCPDAAYAETVGAAHAVLIAARHFPLHRPSRILIKGDNRPIIDFMNSVGKLRRPDLQKLLTEAQHALAFSLPPLIWSYTPREFNKCADFLAGIARDYAKQSLTPDLLPYSLSPFVFPLPPSLSPLYSPPPPLTLSPPSSAFTFQESPDFPISVFPQLARKAAQFPPLQRYLRALQKGPSSIPTISVLYRPTADDQRGRLYPLALGASKLSRHYRALLFGRSHTEIDITGSHYQFFQRFASSLLGISLPSIDQLRHLLKEDFIASISRFLVHHPTSPKDLPTILLNSSLEATLLHYRGKGYWPSPPIREILHQISQTKPRLLAALNSSLGPRTLSSITSANLFFHTMEHPETLWLKSFTAYILSHHSTASLIWLHDGIWEALVDLLAHKAIGFLGGSKPHLPSSMIHSLFQALRTAQASNLPQDRDSPFDLLQYLCDSSLPLSCLPATVWEAEGMVPTAGVTLHLILPHSLRCPADTYFTQVAMHYPHLQYPDGQTVAFGHYEDPLPDQLATKLPTDLQNVPHYCSGYRLLH